jgi:hypothetical protein
MPDSSLRKYEEEQSWSGRFSMLHRMFKALALLFGSLAIIYFSAATVFTFNNDGVQWAMWRDHPMVSLILCGCAIFAAIGWMISTAFKKFYAPQK